MRDAARSWGVLTSVDSRWQKWEDGPPVLGGWEMMVGRMGRGFHFIAGLAAALLVAVAGMTVLASGAQARQRAARASRSRLGKEPAVLIHDSVLAGHRLTVRDVPPDAYGGGYTTSDGTVVPLYMSPQYMPDDSVLQSYADFFDSLYHGAELGDVTIYLAPEDEIHVQCQSNDADSCFDPSSNTIILVGNPPADGTPIEEIAAHEYGHAIALARLNGWGPAYNFGPEYWASYENVCARTAEGTAFPGDEGSHYSQNPGEAWADTNRMLNGGSPNLWQFDPGFFPNSTDFRLAKEDILQPWSGDTRYEATGRFNSRQSTRRSYPLNLPEDGRHASIKLFAHGTLRANLYLYAGGELIAQATGPRRTHVISFTICGGRHARVAVSRRSGDGGYTLQANIP